MYVYIAHIQLKQVFLSPTASDRRHHLTTKHSTTAEPKPGRKASNNKYGNIYSLFTTTSKLLKRFRPSDEGNSGSNKKPKIIIVWLIIIIIFFIVLSIFLHRIQLATFSSVLSGGSNIKPQITLFWGVTIKWTIY